MARKDVDLVIRAKDEAEKVISTITKALGGFVDAQKDVQRSGQGTESTLGALGSALGTLDKQIKGLDLGNTLSKDMDRAAQAVTRLEVASEKTAAEVTDLSRAVDRSEKITSRYQQKLQGATAAQERSTVAVSKAKAESKALDAAYAQSAATVERLTAKQAKLPEQIAKQEVAVAKAATRFADLSAQMAGTTAPSATLTRNFESSKRSVESTGEKLTKLRTELSVTESELRAAGSATAIFGTQATQAAQALAKEETVLKKISANVQGHNVAVKSAGDNQTRLDSQLSKTTASLVTQGQQLQRAEGQYVELAQAAGKFDAALASATGASKGGLEQQLVDQGLAIQKARKEYDVLSNSARKYAEVMTLAGPPTREVSQRMQFMAQRANEAQMKMELQRESAQKMGLAFRNVSGDMASVTQAQAAFIAEQNRLSASLKEVAQDGFRERQAIRESHTEKERAASVTGRLSNANRKLAGDTGKAKVETNGLAAAYRKLYGESRKSLSVTQRLRGQVLSLVAAYGGFYGVIRLLGRVIDAYRVLEGVQNRLNAAFQGDTAQASADFDWLRRNADRLGISLAVLGDEYSKFAVAAKAAGFANDSIRTSFIRVAEAGRVNKLSMEQMSGIFLALQQMISKGKITSEELRRQLGDRLPGAFNIMADALGMTTAELDKAMKAGEVLSDESNMLKFAEELEKRFGGSLAASLETMTTAMGRLGNAAFIALTKFGQGGFIESFTELMVEATEALQSAEFESFMDRLSKATAILIDALTILVENFRLVFAAATAFAAIKLTPIVVALASKMWGLFTAIEASAAGMVTFVRGARVAGTAAAGAAVNVGRLTLAFRALLSSTGIGLLITGIATALSFWATSADQGTEALNLHEKLLDKVKNAYDRVGGSVQDWKDKLEDLTVAEAVANLRRLRVSLQTTKDQIDTLAQGETSFLTNFFGYSLKRIPTEMTEGIKRVFQEFKAGKIPVQDLVVELDRVIAATSDGSDQAIELAESVVKLARDVRDGTASIAEAEKILRVAEGTGEDAQEAFEELAGTVEETGKSMEDLANEKATALEAAMNELGKSVRGVKEELDFIEKSKALDELGRQAIDNVSSVEELIEVFKRLKAAKEGLAEEYVSGAVSGSLVDRIIGVESGGNPSAKNPNSSATGLGQFIESTWLRMFKQYFPDAAAGMSNAAILELRNNADYSRKMVDFYLKENARHLQRAGVAITDANLYLSHFLGPGGAASLLKSAPGTRAEDVLSPGQISANRSILGGKTREEIIAWAERKVGVSAEELSIVEDIQRTERQRAEDARKAAEKEAEAEAKRRDGTASRIEDNAFEIEQQRMKNAEQEREAEILAAIRDAKKANPNITDEEIAKIREQTGALYDLKHATDGVEDAKKKAAEADALVNQLLAQRNALEEQYKLAKADGDTAMQEEFRMKMAEINAEMLAAIENAKTLWAAVGGVEADTAIEKLNAASAAAQRFGEGAVKAKFEWKQVGDLIINGLVSAFDMFAQAVANGESAGEAARKAFLKFAADFLIEIGKMIIKQALLNMMQSIGGGGGFLGKLFGTGHTGGMVGSTRVGTGNSSRRVNPSVFAGAMRYHTGGMIGLRPGEVPIIAKQGEEMLTRDDPRHALNGGGSTGGSSAQKAMTIINTFDPAEAVERALATPRGEEVLVNAVRSRRTEIKAALG